MSRVLVTHRARGDGPAAAPPRTDRLVLQLPRVELTQEMRIGRWDGIRTIIDIADDGHLQGARRSLLALFDLGRQGEPAVLTHRRAVGAPGPTAERNLGPALGARALEHGCLVAMVGAHRGEVLARPVGRVVTAPRLVPLACAPGPPAVGPALRGHAARLAVVAAGARRVPASPASSRRALAPCIVHQRDSVPRADARMNLP